MTKPGFRRLPCLRAGRSQRCAAVAGALTAASLLLATSSYAGTYIVDSCRVPSGIDAGATAPLEVSEGAAAAPGEWNRISSGEAMYGDTCGSGGSLMAGLSDEATHGTGDTITWQFTAPLEERITKATIWRAGDAEGGSGYMLWMSGPQAVAADEVAVSEHVFSGCAYSYGCTSLVGDPGSPLSSSNKVLVPANDIGGPHLYISATCTRATCPEETGDEHGNAVIVNIYATEMELEETRAPTVSGVSGELATADNLSGEVDLSYQAEDEGSGVYEQVIEVDGKEVQRSVVDPDGGHCAPLEEAGAPPLTFLYPQPCPHSATGHVSLETESLANGLHSLDVSVTNAAGDSTAVLERQIDVDNGSTEGTKPGEAGEGATGSEGNENSESNGDAEGTGEDPTGSEGGEESGSSGGGRAAGSTLTDVLPGAGLPSAPPLAANGSPASSSARLTAKWVGAGGSKRPRARSVLVARFGGHHRIAGRLTTADGAPIRGALITIDATPVYGGAHTEAMKAVRTSASGRFAVSLPARESSRSIELRYSPTIGGEPVTRTTMRLHVSAGVRLKVTPSHSHAGGTIHLKGRVLGGPIPKAGKEVVLEARSSGTRWLQFDVLHTDRAGRFQGSHRFRLPGPIRYEFRAVCPQEADFPFAAGTSRVVGVFER